MAFRPQPASEFGRIAKYVKYLRQFPRAGQVKPGNFYAYVYDFDKETEPYRVIKFWDTMPFTFVYELNAPIKGMYRGINFHHVPVRPRQIWLARANQLVEEDMRANKRLVRLSRWYILFHMLKKLSKKSVRNYYMERTHKLRRIPNDAVAQAMRYYANTYYGINISNVEKEYLKFRWNK